MSHNFFFSINSVNLVKCLLSAKQAVSDSRLTNSYLSAHYVPDCCDARGWICKVMGLVFYGMTYVRSIFHHIMHFVSPGSLQGREDNPVPYLCFFSVSLELKKCILENVRPVVYQWEEAQVTYILYCTK